MPPLTPPYNKRQKLRDRHIQREALRPFWTALAKRESSPVDIVAVGNSLTEGFGVSTPEKRWVYRLLSKLRDRYPTPGVTGGQGYISANYHLLNSAASPGAVQLFTQTGGDTDPSYLYGLGRRARHFTASGDQLAITVTCSSFDVVATSGGSNSYMDVTIDGGAPVQFNLLSPNGQLWPGNWFNSGPLTPGAHDIVIACNSGIHMFIEGMMPYNGDETCGIRMWEAGHGGALSGYYNSGFWLLPQTATNRGSFYNIRPDLVIIELGVNDLFNDVAPATVATNVATLIAQMDTAIASRPSPRPSYLILIPHQVGGSFAYPWSDYIDVLWEVALADGGVAIIDFTDLMGTATTASGLFHPDLIHLGDAGAEFWANAIANTLEP